MIRENPSTTINGSTGKNYFPQLDALRGLSFLAVFLYHAFHPVFSDTVFGRAGKYFYGCLDYSIDVFFVLSAFLLTYLGITEYERRGRFSFGNYFLRRALRIWPLYYALMVFAFVAVPLVAARFGYDPALPSAHWYLFFVSNFYTAEHAYFLRFLWTLSVEEQFYLVLGVTLLLFQKHLSKVVTVLFFTGVIFCVWGTLTGTSIYFNTLAYLADFAAGAAAAVLLKKNRRLPQFIAKMTGLKYAAFYALVPVTLITVFFLAGSDYTPKGQFIQFLGRLVFVVFTAAFILEQMLNKNTLLAIGKSRFLVYTGKISYGLYCFHGIVLSFGGVLLARTKSDLPDAVTVALFLVVNFLLAAISYRFFELPFLRIKDRFRKI